jgi:hypothetical protein
MWVMVAVKMVLVLVADFMAMFLIVVGITVIVGLTA